MLILTLLILQVNGVNVKGLRKNSRGDFMAVNKRAIVMASIDILNRDGVENLSMRTIAKALNVKAAALYNHISGKLELYNEIAEYMCEQNMSSYCVHAPNAHVSEICKAHRAMLLTVRDSVAIFQESHPNTPLRIEMIRSQMRAMSMLSIKQGFLSTAANMLNNYVLSFVADELRFKNTPSDQFAQLAEILSQEEKSVFANIGNYDEYFEYGLSVILMGLENVR